LSVFESRRTALVHDWLTGMRGGEKVLEALATLVPEAPIYTLLHVPGSVAPELEAHAIHSSWIARLPAARRGYRRYLPLFPSAIEDFDLNGFDLVLSTSHCVAKGVIPPPGALHICYCHSPMRYAWDQEHVYFPRRHGPAARLRNLLLSSLRTWDAASADRVDLFIANSRFVAERIRRYYRRQAEVIPPPVAVEAFAAKLSHGTFSYEERSEPVVRAAERCLMVAALAPYKRIEVAIAACRRLGLGLDIVGTGPELRRLKRQTGEGVAILGRVEHQRLVQLYRRAFCLLQPGVEDFGIAAVEALASGTPVVALGHGGVLDIVDDGVHGVLYGRGEPRASLAEADFEEDVTQLEQAIERCRAQTFDHRQLEERAERFSTARFLTRMRARIEQALAERSMV